MEPASSNQAPDDRVQVSPSPVQVVPVVDKRELEDPADGSETPQKLPNISSICSASAVRRGLVS